MYILGLTIFALDSSWGNHLGPELDSHVDHIAILVSRYDLYLYKSWTLNSSLGVARFALVEFYSSTKTCGVVGREASNHLIILRSLWSKPSARLKEGSGRKRRMSWRRRMIALPRRL